MIENLLYEQRRDSNRTRKTDSINLLDSALPHLTAGQVRNFDLTANDKQFAALKVGTRHGCNDVGEAWAGGNQRKSPTTRGDLIEIFRGDTGRYLMDHWNASESMTATFQQMHDVSAGDKKAVSVAELG